MLSQAKQLELLRQMGAGSARALLIGMALLSAGLAVAGLVTGDQPYFMAAFFFGVVTAGSWGSERHLRNAVRGIEQGRRVPGRAVITIEDGLDNDHYHALTDIPGSKAWRFEFRPLGWRPAVGEIEVVAYFLDDIEWPVLLVGNEGLLAPRDTPRAMTTPNPSPSS